MNYDNKALISEAHLMRWVTGVDYENCYGSCALDDPGDSEGEKRYGVLKKTCHFSTAYN